MTDYLSRDQIAAIYGISFTLVRKRLKPEDVFFSAESVRKAVESYQAEGWKPGTKKCSECGKWLPKREFHIMESSCKFCHSKSIETRSRDGNAWC